MFPTLCKTTNTHHSLKTQSKLEAKGPPYLEEGKSRTGQRKSSSHNAKRNSKMTLISNVNWTVKGLKIISFFPNRKAKHRVPKTFSDSNLQQKEVKKNKGKKRKMKTSDEESNEDEIQVNIGIGRHLASNHLVLLPITGRVHQCNGCRAQFADGEWKQPQDLVFRIQMNRQYPKDGQIKTSLKKAICFFMRDLGCVR